MDFGKGLLFAMDTWSNLSKSSWDQMSENWQVRTKQMWDEGSRKEIIPLFRKYLGNTSLRLLDIGCGAGYSSYVLAQQGHNVTGMDLSDEMIARAMQDYVGVERLQFVVGNLLQTPFPEHYFDGLLSINALEWVEHPLDGILEFRRIVKSGGILCIGVLGPTAGPRAHSFPRLQKEQVIQNTMMPWEFSQLMGDHGFKLLDHLGVYRKEVRDQHLIDFPLDLKQALSFMWVFIYQKI